MSPPNSSSPAPSAPGPSTPTPLPPTGDEKPELPWAFIDCPTDTLVILISHMLNLLIQHNDQVILTPDALTRFHSRAAPGISVIEYLRRIVKYTNMEKIPLLSLLAYIDITCQHLPTFTLSSLTVHRFLIAGVCAGSKAQCDVFCTNGHYAKVGGIKVHELNSLERELLRVTQWALCCNADLLQRYYTSLIKSHGGYTQASAPSTIPYRPFPRSSSKPRPLESPSRAVSTPPAGEPIEEDPSSPAADGDAEDAEVGEEDTEMDRDPDPEATTSTAPPGNDAVPGKQNGGERDDMDVDPPDRPLQGGASLHYSPHSEASSSIPSSSNSPRSSTRRFTRLQNKQMHEGQPAPPQLDKQTATPHRTPEDPTNPTTNAGVRRESEYGKVIGHDEEMLVAPPVQTPSSSRPSSATPLPTSSKEQQEHHHHHHLHAPSGKAIKNLVGGIFHRKSAEPPDRPTSAASSSSHSQPASSSRPQPQEKDYEPPLQHTDLHNGLEQSTPAQPTHPAGEGEPWQPSSMIGQSSSPRVTARIPRSPRVGVPSPRLQSVAGRPEAVAAVTPKIRTRDERSTENMRDGERLSGLTSATVGAVRGEEGKRRAV